jgi:DNA-binding protein HU-beta
MSLRDFNAIDDDPISLHSQPLGNESGLGTFHTVQPEDAAPSNTPKIVGGLAVALMIGVAGFGFYYQANSSSSLQPKPVVTASNVPAPAAPIAPDAQSDAQQAAQAAKAAKAATADPDSLRAAQVKTPAAASMDQMPAPAKTASAKPARSRAAASTGAASSRMSADFNQTSKAAAQQPVVTPTAPSPSDVATTNTQSSVAVPSDATTASDIPAPAPQEQPAPAQPSPAQ